MTTKLNPGKPDGRYKNWFLHDEDGDCDRCGLTWTDEEKSGEVDHECPPGFWHPSPQPSAEEDVFDWCPECGQTHNLEDDCPKPAPSGEKVCDWKAVGWTIDPKILGKIEDDPRVRAEGDPGLEMVEAILLAADWKPLAPEATTKPRPIHETIAMQVWVDVDEPISGLVRYLNTLDGVRTHASCQGTLGEGGPHPYRAYVEASWPEELESRLIEEFDVEKKGTHWGHIQPKVGWVAPGEAVGRETRELQRNDVVGQVLQEFGFKSAAALRTVIVDMRMAESTLRRERDQLKETLDLAVEDTNELDKEVAKLESQVRELTAQRDNFEFADRSHSKQLAEHVDFLQERNAEVAELRAAVEKLERAIEKLLAIADTVYDIGPTLTEALRELSDMRKG